MDSEIVCPHCNYEFVDSEEFNFSVYGSSADFIDINCPNCEKDFECERVINYKTYSRDMD